MLVLLLACMVRQDPEVDAEIAALDDPSPDVRDKAESVIAKRGVAVFQRLLAARANASPEARRRLESLLLQAPFPACALVDDPAFRDVLDDAVLKEAREHAGHPECWAELGPPRTLKVEGVRIGSQGGSGHGQSIELVTLAGSGRSLSLRRWSYRAPTPCRPKVLEERMTLEAGTLGPRETIALLRLLGLVLALRPACSIPLPEAGGWMSTGSFTCRMVVESVGHPLWSGGYTGYPSSSDQPKYRHPRAVKDVIDAALASGAWTPVAADRADLDVLREWGVSNFDKESWWVREHYLSATRLVGDRTSRPFLESFTASADPAVEASGKRQRDSANAALERIRRLPSP